MSGAYKWMKLSECDVDDVFFDSLKVDYPGFETWFNKKAKEGKEAFTYFDDLGLGAFVMLKPNEKEELVIADKVLPARNRLKISTLKLCDRIQGNRLGEGAIGIALWKWLESDCEEIYVTVFGKHQKLIEMLQKFGFEYMGNNLSGEGIYLRSKETIDFSTPYSSFPFISKNNAKCFLLPIEAKWHDKLFPYAELSNTVQKNEEIAAANGVTKTYICFPYYEPSYTVGCPIMIYRIAQENKSFKSVVTSYGTIVKWVKVKQDNNKLLSLEEYKRIVGNKSVFTDDEIEFFYMKQKNLYVLELVYDHAFGKGHNVNNYLLNQQGIWKSCHPYQAVYSLEDFKQVLMLARQDTNKLIK